jgi:uncharacterized protein
VRNIGYALGKFIKIVLMLCVLSQSACAQSNEPMRLPLDPVPLTVITEKGRTNIKIEIARTPVERSRGLMFREELPDGRGMLFVFDDVDILNFWMKNTPEPLDIIYIAAGGKVVSIQSGVPYSTDPVPSGGPAQYVLELARGQAELIGLKPGDVFTHPSIVGASK